MKCSCPFELSDRLLIGEVFDCVRCGTPLEVAELDPPMLVPFRRIEEDPADFADFGGFQLL